MFCLHLITLLTYYRIRPPAENKGATVNVNGYPQRENGIPSKAPIAKTAILPETQDSTLLNTEDTPGHSPYGSLTNLGVTSSLHVSKPLIRRSSRSPVSCPTKPCWCETEKEKGNSDQLKHRHGKPYDTILSLRRKILALERKNCDSEKLDALAGNLDKRFKTVKFARIYRKVPETPCCDLPGLFVKFSKTTTRPPWKPF